MFEYGIKLTGQNIGFQIGSSDSRIFSPSRSRISCMIDSLGDEWTERVKSGMKQAVGQVKKRQAKPNWHCNFCFRH